MPNATPALRPACLLAIAAALLTVTPACAEEQGARRPPEHLAQARLAAAKQRTAAPQPVRLAVQVSDSDPKAMTLALNNVSNLFKHYKPSGRPVSIEVVTYGPGLAMLREDTSPVKARVAEMALAHPNLKFTACLNTRNNMQKQEGKPVKLLTEAGETASGVVRLIELQEQGYAYIRP